MTSDLGAVLLQVAMVTLPFAIVTVVVSALTHQPIENGVRAIGWLLVVVIAAAAAGSAVDPSIAIVAVYLAGAVVTYALARRDGYEFDRMSWALLFLWVIGYWIVLWRRENEMWRRRIAAVAQAR